ncbi:YchE family NAAT transporter [Thiomicrorhabdus sp. 6S3-12]|uniref:YchE family NAAT transporter n=1 Tax=Thiomicrorhabdus sp. 6S3-12 TaxID=2819681 RepID=UPI001AAD7CF6|nr:YchE family NAAT transporter [Thiomicrorhabdus sp. 6S3-12]MBO1924911.1 YchE family NAAT transporter [Thiomicrorhabdus sp. 6S3-12]
MEYTEYTKFLVGLIAVVNPIGALPIFLAMTSDLSLPERKKIVHITVTAVAAILLVALFFGEAILEFFGISINSFRVGGGILILLMAISMMHTKGEKPIRSKEDEFDSEQNDSIGVVPLAMPLLAGPGAISAVIIEAHRQSGVAHYGFLGLDILILSFLLWVTLMMTPWFTRHISQVGINIITRIMGLLLAAIAIEFIANGLKGLFPSLA